MIMKHITLPSLAIAAGLSIASPALADNNDAETISVSGIGIVSAAPDMATINLSVLREAKTARDALTANSAAMNDVLNAMKSFGIEDKDLQTSNFSIQPRYVYPKRTNGEQKPPSIVAYQVSNSLTVRIRDLEKVGDILDKSVSLGVNQGGNIYFSNADPEPLQMQARANAMKNAIKKAQVLTDAAGIELGKIKQISEHSNSPRPQPVMRAEMAKAMVADSAPVPVAGGENTYRITVNVTFELDQ